MARWSSAGAMFDVPTEMWTAGAQAVIVASAYVFVAVYRDDRENIADLHSLVTNAQKESANPGWKVGKIHRLLANYGIEDSERYEEMPRAAVYTSYPYSDSIDEAIHDADFTGKVEKEELEEAYEAMRKQVTLSGQLVCWCYRPLKFLGVHEWVHEKEGAARSLPGKVGP